MYRRRFLVSLAALLSTGVVAEAAMKAGPNVMPGGYHHRLKGVAGDGALDGFTTPTLASGFRKQKSAYGGSAIRLRRASDNAELDIGFLGFVPGIGAPWNEAAAVAHCAATTCFVPIWYDESGAARDLVQPTAGNQPQLIFNCNGSLPCVRMTLAGHQLSTAANITPVNGIVTLNVVARRTVGTGGCIFLRENGSANRIIGQSAVANSWQLAPPAVISKPATDNVWHAAVGVINTTSSLFNVDGSETTGNITGSTVAGLAGVAGIASTTCDVSELALWDAYVMPPAERAALIANERSFHGTP